MPIVNGVKRYSSVSVVQIVLGNHPRAQQNQAELGAVWLDYGFTVRNINQTSLGLVSNNLDASDLAAADWCTTWLESEEAAQEAADDEDKLLVVCYFGHGGTRRATPRNRFMDDHLIVAR
jgi:hypothetical protein